MTMPSKYQYPAEFPLTRARAPALSLPFQSIGRPLHQLPYIGRVLGGYTFGISLPDVPGEAFGEASLVPHHVYV